MKELFEKGRLAWRLFNDSRVPGIIRWGIPVVAVAYLLTPVDLIPDFLLGLGQLDDLGILLLALTLMIRLSPQHIVDEHSRALGMDVAATGRTPSGKSGGSIDGEYKVVPPGARR